MAYHTFSKSDKGSAIIAGRVVSILSGTLSLFGVIYLGKNFFNTRTALVAGVFFAITPFLVFFDRMALTDSLLAGFSFWSLILAMEVARGGSIKKTTILGVTLGLSVLTKTPGISTFISLPVALIITNFQKIKKTVIHFITAGAIGTIIYNFLRFSLYFERLSQRNDYYHFPIKRLLKKPFDPFVGNIGQAIDFMFKMMTWPIFLLFIFGVFYSLYKKRKNKHCYLFMGCYPNPYNDISS